ncbi:hypothetical protein MMC22_005539 [Lobaria immixta]|nr:hypothetical protein [Lobaria immixta]
MRYKREGKLEDLTQTIEYSQEAIDLTPVDNLNRAGWLNNLSAYLSTRYEREGKLEDLTQAIECTQEAVNLTPVGNPDRASWLNNLSVHLGTRYRREGKLEDLTQAIEYCQKAVNLLLFGNPDRVTLLNSLSSHLSMRYERERKLEDLAQAIEYTQDAVDLTPVGNPNRASWLHNLSNRFSTRYEREEKEDDLAQAIKCSQEAIDLTSAGSPNQVTLLNSLSNHLRKRYERKRKLEDLTQAIEYTQKAVNLTPVGNPDRASLLNNLSAYLSKRYKREGKLEDLTQAIEYSQDAIDLISIGNPDRAGWLNNLSNHLSTRYGREQKLEDLTQAIEHSQNAFKCLNSPLPSRLDGCRRAIDLLALSQKCYEAQEMLDYGLEIFPFLISNLSSKLDQEHMMKSVAGIAAIGCAVSLQCDNDGYKAIRILELSRGTINRLTINSRADMSTLYHLHPDLAKRFEDLRFLMNAPTDASGSVGKVTLKRESVMSELNELISTIRTKVGFEDFQNLPSQDKLFETTLNQVIVLVNATRVRTDALLIHSNKQVQTLPLDQSIFKLSGEYYEKMCNRFGYNDPEKCNDPENSVNSNKDMRDFLKWLWDQVVEPILGAFSFEPSKIPSEHHLLDDPVETACLIQHRHADGPKDPDPNRLAFYRRLLKRHPNMTSSVRSSGSSQARFTARTGTTDLKFPRIHWIGVGHMSAFPFHAAGYGSQDARKNTMSCAISSYASTLTARAYAKQKPVTPGLSDLEGVEREAKIIQETVEGHMAVKQLEMQRVNVVLDDLPLYNHVHFACHGYANPQSPFQSELILKDGALTVETISSINTERSQLAFLSACCTAENASLKLMDEGINLANGFQLAGYPHVIASLWEADDDLSVAIAEKFYRILCAESSIDGHERRHERIASALHDAVLSAQQIVLYGRQILDEPLSWAPTIHIGP